MNIFKKIQLFNNVISAVKEFKKLRENNTQLADDTQKVVLNLKADIETLIALSPAYRKIANDVMAIINKVL